VLGVFGVVGSRIRIMNTRKQIFWKLNAKCCKKKIINGRYGHTYLTHMRVAAFSDLV
jgi:hypothetical protein